MAFSIICSQFSRHVIIPSYWWRSLHCAGWVYESPDKFQRKPLVTLAFFRLKNLKKKRRRRTKKNLERHCPCRDIIPLLDDSYKSSSEIAYQNMESTPSHPISDSTTTPPKCIWGANFSFDSTSLVGLKSLAMETITSPQMTPSVPLSGNP